jgi:hypothetical protein
MAQIVIGKAGLFRAKEDCDAAQGQSAVNPFRRSFERLEFVLHFAMAYGGGALPDYSLAWPRD